MGRLTNSQARVTDSDLIDFMSEFARYLIAGGVSSARFAESTKLAFLRAAADHAKFSNNRLNQSALAAMTGLSRTQVRHFARRNSAVPKLKIDRVQNAIRGWSTDPTFSTSNYLPRRLSLGADSPTFNQLARKYGSDVSARSLLREMVRTGAAKVKNGQVELNSNARQTRGELTLQHVSRALTQLLKESSGSPVDAIPWKPLLGEVGFPSASPKGRALLQRKYADALRAFSAELQAAGIAASFESPIGKTKKGRVSRTRVLILTEELDSRDSDVGSVRKIADE